MRFLAASLLLIAPTSLTATVTLSGAIGALRDSEGEVLDNTHLTTTSTLWALVVDNGDSILPGGLGPNGSLQGGVDSAAAYSVFAGVDIGIGLDLGGDTVLMIGDVDPNTGFALPFVSGIDLTSSGLAGRRYALYWFPGQDVGNTQLPSTGSFQVGGINELAGFDSGAPSPIGMQIPSSDGTFTTNVFDNNFGGALPTTRFEAIVAVPEPSVGLFSLFGLALLRRRR